MRRPRLRRRRSGSGTLPERQIQRKRFMMLIDGTSRRNGILITAYARVRFARCRMNGIFEGARNGVGGRFKLDSPR